MKNFEDFKAINGRFSKNYVPTDIDIPWLTPFGIAVISIMCNKLLNFEKCPPNTPILVTNFEFLASVV